MIATFNHSLSSMPPPPTYEICTCTKCACQKWKSPSGQYINGALQSTAVKQKHMRAEERRKAPPNAPDQEQGQELGDVILISTVASIPPPPGEHVPSRLYSDKRSRPADSGAAHLEASTPSRKRQRAVRRKSSYSLGLSHTRL